MTRQTFRRRYACAAVLSAFAFAACKDDNGPKPPSAVTAASSPSLAGVVGEELATPLTVKVTDAGGSALSGIAVTFSVAEGGGAVTPAVDTTDGSGLASTKWRLGERTGVAQRVTASVSGVTAAVNFIATTSPGAPSIISVQGGDNQTAAAGAAVATPPSVLLKDRFSNPVPGVSVFFSVASGGGSITGAGATTNANGVASLTEWKLGPNVGTNRLTALAVFNGVTGNPINFTATATAGAPASAAPIAGSSTTVTGNAGALVTPVPGVRVLDATGNPVQGVAVTFSASTGSTVVGGTKNTDANGVASPDGWQLGTVAQNYTLTASIGTLTPIVFTATARPGVPAQMTIAAGNNQSVIAGRVLPVEPSVRVADSFNNPIAGIEVVFDVISGGGSAVARRPVTNASGIATVGGWTLGEDIGTNTLRATIQALNVTGNPITFTATALPGVPVSMTVSAGVGQSATVGTAVATSPSVVVRDSRGNPVPGITVTFVITSGGGTLIGATAITSAAGVATVGSWILGNTAGVQTMVARVTNLPDVTFSATATAGAAATMTAVSTTTLGSFVAQLGQSATPLPSVRITDVAGNPVPGVVVTFSTGNATSGAIAGEVQSTNANGVATLGSWTLPTVTGVASIIASAPGLAGVTFVATIQPSAATQLVLTSTTPATAAATTQVPVALQLRDQFGNNVSTAGVTINFVAAGPGGPTATTPLLTNASGVAISTWTLGTTGTHTLTITSAGLNVPSVLSVVVP